MRTRFGMECGRVWRLVLPGACLLPTTQLTPGFASRGIWMVATKPLRSPKPSISVDGRSVASQALGLECAPHGDQGPFFRAQIDGREAQHQPARENLEQAEVITQQSAQQQSMEQAHVRPTDHAAPAITR